MEVPAGYSHCVRIAEDSNRQDTAFQAAQLIAGKSLPVFIPDGKGRLRLGDGSVEYTLLQPGSPPISDTLIVMLHEGLGSMSMWKTFPADVASATRCAVLVYSRFGYGNSTPCVLPRPLSYMHDEAGLLAELIDQSGFGRTMMVGHSDGASIATIYAGAHAGPSLAGIVLMAPHFYTEKMALDEIRLAKTAYDQGELRVKLKRYHGKNVDIAFRGWNNAWLDPSFHDWDIREYIPRIRVPALLIQGAEDEYGSISQLDTMRSLAATPVTTLLLQNCRHSPHRDCPAETLNAIAEFVAAHLEK